jgi:cytoskeletal protein RodZ
LKLTREVLGVELQEIALGTGIPVSHLRNIERERFDLLPPRGYVRIYVSRYAQYLALDAPKVTSDYMKAYKMKK